MGAGLGGEVVVEPPRGGPTQSGGELSLRGRVVPVSCMDRLGSRVVLNVLRDISS